MVRLRGFGIFIFAGFMMLAGQTAYAEKYAFLDVAKTFDEYQKTKDNDAKLQEVGKEKEDALCRLTRIWEIISIPGRATRTKI